MKFGLLYIPDYYPDRYKSASHYYGEMMEQIQHAEELGFDVCSSLSIMSAATPFRRRRCSLRQWHSAPNASGWALE